MTLDAPVKTAPLLANLTPGRRSDGEVHSEESPAGPRCHGPPLRAASGRTISQGGRAYLQAVLEADAKASPEDQHPGLQPAAAMKAPRVTQALRSSDVSGRNDGTRTHVQGPLISKA